MSKSQNKPCIGEQSEATTRDHERFIDCHRLVLLRYLNGMAPVSAEEPDGLLCAYADWPSPRDCLSIFDGSMDIEIPLPPPFSETS